MADATTTATRAVPQPDHHDTHLTNAQTPLGPGVGSQSPETMPRAEDDAATRAGSPEFHDRPGSGKHTADRMTYY